MVQESLQHGGIARKYILEIICLYRRVQNTFIEINITGHKRIDSFIEVESHTPFASIKELQEDGEYVALPQFVNSKKLLPSWGGCIHRSRIGPVYSVAIFPAGRREKGHSILIG